MAKAAKRAEAQESLLEYAEIVVEGK